LRRDEQPYRLTREEFVRQYVEVEAQRDALVLLACHDLL